MTIREIEERIFVLLRARERRAVSRPTFGDLEEADALDWILMRLRVEFPDEHREAMRRAMRQRRKDTR